ncbi:unnamed protein product [Blepharisma stoltei]|uniref:CBM20 domain-containing protein n=1 Tax=Blepharisma stoltei TaxID=1481888 RepID=A0AAU9JL17_9CILI|nr:unnamed protein product [Blepharisma stoltei]
MEQNHILGNSNSESPNFQGSAETISIPQNNHNLTKNCSLAELPYQNHQEIVHLSEQQQNINYQGAHNNKCDIGELKKNPELYRKMLNEVIKLENEKIRPTSYLLRFRMHYKTLFEEKLVVVGGEEFLGDWDPNKGLELEWRAGDYWEISILIGEGELPEFEYKYVCLKRNHALWENGPNRIFKIRDGVKKGSTLFFNKEDCWQK